MQCTRGEDGVPTEDRRFGEEIDDLAARMYPFGLLVTAERKQRMRRYCELLVAWSRRRALLSRRDIDHVLPKHVGASLGALLLVTPDHEKRWIDVGTGAGLPGLVLKAWEPAQEIVLVEASRKKGIFLENAVRELGLGPVDIQIARVETLLEKGNVRGRFDVVFVRAVTDLKTTLRMFGPVIGRGGRVVTFKGPSWRGDVDDATKDGILAPQTFSLEQVLCVPWSPGHLLLLRKNS